MTSENKEVSAETTMDELIKNSMQESLSSVLGNLSLAPINIPTTQSESLPKINTNVAPTILSIPRADPNNKWKDFLCIEKMDKQAIMPTKGSPLSAGYDIYPFDSGIIYPWTSALIGTKLKITVPVGTYGRLASRSGLASKNNIEVGAGVIDIDYQGEVKVLLRNNSDNAYVYSRDKAIAQLILEKHTIVPIKEIVNQEQIFGVTERGANGFGSSDVVI